MTGGLEHVQPKHPREHDLDTPRFFTTTLFLHPELPPLNVLTFPARYSSPKESAREVAQSGWRLLRGEQKEWEIRLGEPYEVDLQQVIKAISDLLLQFNDEDNQTGGGARRYADLMKSEAFPVMNSPISGTTLGQLFATFGSGAAFYAYFPHPEMGQIAIYFLVAGGTRIVLGAADGIAVGLKQGLSHLILKWMGAPPHMIEAEKEAAARSKGTTRNKKTDETDDPIIEAGKKKAAARNGRAGQAKTKTKKTNSDDKPEDDADLG